MTGSALGVEGVREEDGKEVDDKTAVSGERGVRRVCPMVAKWLPRERRA